ncbi:LysE family translocator [Agrobacterium pusense]|uniref:LysE family translocator n=1 Tax=Agrobacterium pusense TaxID=648995 RepID=UPI00088B559B|nr:LysE family translocator [Agrobacterium pusense]OOO22958.1 amino acid transporter [Agrobacterium pusense]WKD48069.1 LysE family translocator [Agrobacterium pusense]SDF59319.1 Threonine/homoserine/homoserine lactone efflux protein [Agrobacterium pusense]
MSDLSTYLDYIWPAYIAYLIALVTPGPANFAIMGAAISQGRRAGLMMALGVFCGSLTWACGAALGLATLLRTYAFALEVVKVIGGLYLLFLAWKALKAARKSAPDLTITEAGAQHSGMQLWLRGYAIHVTNPKAVFAWLAIISLGLPPNAPGPAVALIVGICCSSSLVIFSSYALIFSTRHALNAYLSARRWIEITMAAFYGLAGVKLLTSRI